MLAAMEKFISCYSVKNNSSKCSAHFPQCENDFPPFLKKYRESNVFYEKKLYTPQYGRMNKLLSPKNISSNQLFSNFFRKTSLSRNFFQLNTKEFISRDIFDEIKSLAIFHTGSWTTTCTNKIKFVKIFIVQFHERFVMKNIKIQNPAKPYLT